MTYSFMNLDMKLQIPTNSENIANATTDPRLECSYQSNFFRSYHKSIHKSWSNFILTKIQPYNINQTSAAKYWTDFSFKISPELCTTLKFCLYNNLVLWSNFSFQICTKLLCGLHISQHQHQQQVVHTPGSHQLSHQWVSDKGSQ